jgi:hypothetical protein
MASNSAERSKKTSLRSIKPSRSCTVQTPLQPIVCSPTGMLACQWLRKPPASGVEAVCVQTHSGLAASSLPK